MKNRILTVASATTALALAAAPCFAAAMVDYTAIGTSITSELTPALASVVPIAGTLLAVGVGWKFVKRFTK